MLMLKKLALICLLLFFAAAFAIAGAGLLPALSMPSVYFLIKLEVLFVVLFGSFTVVRGCLLIDWEKGFNPSWATPPRGFFVSWWITICFCMLVLFQCKVWLLPFTPG